ncbi:hypothetical protein [Acinetobacter sp. YH16055]|uniref:hypothetical protein n=1 Tax=Acinetobacter sp. YH16055 TaxID=2601193 RepID=UPI0015D43852|nr:hypothetical protein [Acinetobacter sp. YH16055]
MFKALKELLLSVAASTANTNYLRIIVVAGIVIPLVITLYGYFDEIIQKTNESLTSISSITGRYDGKSVDIGTYAISFMGLAKLDVCLVTIFTYITTAVVWSFTYDLKPLFARK